MRWILTAIATVGIAFGVAACSDGDPKSPESVVEAYFAAWSAEDVDRIMTYVAPDASLEIDNLGTFYTGAEEIRSAFESVFDRWDFTFEVSNFETEDDDTVSYNVVATDSGGSEVFRVRSQATVQDGLMTAEEQIGGYQE